MPRDKKRAVKFQGKTKLSQLKTKKPKKTHKKKFNPGDYALREIKKYQSNCDNLMPR